MNMKNNPNVKELKELFSKFDDVASDHVLWVSIDGDVNISEIQNNQAWRDWKQYQKKVQYYYERYHRNKGYVGPAAANDDAFISRRLSDLKADWDRKAEGGVEIPGFC